MSIFALLHVGSARQSCSSSRLLAAPAAPRGDRSSPRRRLPVAGPPRCRPRRSLRKKGVAAGVEEEEERGPGQPLPSPSFFCDKHTKEKNRAPLATSPAEAADRAAPSRDHRRRSEPSPRSGHNQLTLSLPAGGTAAAASAAAGGGASSSMGSGPGGASMVGWTERSVGRSHAAEKAEEEAAPACLLAAAGGVVRSLARLWGLGNGMVGWSSSAFDRSAPACEDCRRASLSTAGDSRGLAWR